ncbi:MULTISPECIES: type II toxin-antitoxin system VapC family toxin [Leptospira]|uniref:Ribonuclease VapC n=3 Tax=Leptospira weilii TaxID=28184 RepID=A0A828Z772_9LEPT|nr:MULTISPECIES: type II toxin-antitoxin system VapC family toxin [Leptospira]EMM73396.1 PIN domain protein [Leptospira weilii str. 2006001855]EKR65305.1 PIN domain protein [Leptospira weilii str. 2006001853]EMN44838.1 PIN domain protein [Leptospira weilii str. LNT 1234]EMN88039.1 PIN domain protein [Leptospira weilii str. UI 13098]MCL8266480.1 type II toxin-antitoxin system VapC family toxin [Leptospira weilii]
MTQYLLDTNICIYIINQKPESVYKKFKKIKLENIFISSITEFELKYGVQKSLHFERNLKVLEEFLSYLNILPFVSEDTNKAAKVRVELERVGKPIGPFDLLIASQALSNKLTLVTNNEKEFTRIKEIKIENWL